MAYKYNLSEVILKAIKLFRDLEPYPIGALPGAKPMFKTIFIVFVLILTFACFGCGNGANDNSGGESPVEDIPDEDIPDEDIPDEDIPAVDCDNIWWSPNHGVSFYEDNPTYIDSRDDTADWNFSDPESQNMDPQILEAGAAELASEPYLYSLVIVRNDAIVFERYFNGSASNKSNNIHSASKSIISALVGIAIDEGFIDSVDQKVSDIIPEYFSANDANRDTSLHNLLTMSAGIRWREDSTEYRIEIEEDWVQAILDLEQEDLPGEQFKYSTGLSHVMSAVLTEATGTSVCQFAHQMLFDPLQITAEHWGRDPQMINCGGFNLYMTPREMAKFGLLILNRGDWHGNQLVPEAFLEQSVQAQMVSVPSGTYPGYDYDYGYYWWLVQILGHPVYIAWGFGGQYICIIEDLDLVIVTTSDTYFNDTGQEIDIVEFIQNYIIPSINDSA